MRIQKLVFLFSFLFFISFSAHAFASTLIDTDITEDTTWTQNQSPYIVSSYVSVSSGVILSIDPGVVVKFKNGNSLVVYGRLNALGTENSPIYFTSNYDDELGGNTDDEEICHDDIDVDGNVVGQICETIDPGDPIKGDWNGISFIDSTNSNLENVSFRYAYGAVALTSSSTKFKNLNVSDSNSGLTIYSYSHAEVLGGVFSNLNRDVFAVFNDSSLFSEDIDISNVSGEGIVVFNNSSLDFKNLKISDIYGDPVAIFNDSFFVGDNFKIENVFAEYTDVIALFNHSNLSLKNSSFKNCPDEACITLFDGYNYISKPSSINIENTVFDGGVSSGILSFGDSNMTANIKNSVFKNFGLYAVENYSDFTVNAENNYWNDASGPYHETLNPAGLGTPVYGNISFDPWCKNEACKTRNPVIIIPGVLGTEINKPVGSELEKLWLNLARNLKDIGDEFMDPLQFNADLTPSDTSLTIGDVIRKISFLSFSFDYSDGLIKEFQNQGYVEGTDLFLFPYDWRYGVSEDTVNQLRQKIQSIKTQTGSDKVDVVAHSTGGLLVKKYITENLTGSNIGKAVFVGVPNTGAPKAIKALIQGDNFGDYFVADGEMKKITENLPVAYDLSPSESYFNTKGSYIKIISQRGFASKPHNLNFDEANSYLIHDHDLNAQALIDAHGLHTANFDNYDIRTAGVDLYAIDGCKTGTIGKFIESRNYGLFGDTNYTRKYSLEYTSGDGTVPFESATNLPINEENTYYALKSEHGKMLSQDGIRQEIVSIISGGSLSIDGGLVTQDISKCKLNGKVISISGPLNIDVTDQNGNHSGLLSDGISLENNIPNASFEIMGENKFIYLPDEGQTYAIKIKGIGNGSFTVKNENIKNNQTIKTQVFSNIPVTKSLIGQIYLSGVDTLSVDNNGDGKIDKTIQPSTITY